MKIALRSLFTVGLLFFCLIRGFGQDQPEIRLGFQMTPGFKRISVPFSLHNNLVVIKVILNDALPLSFILDTGVRTSILTDKTFTDLLNVNYSRKFIIRGAGGQKLVDAYVANDVTLDIGGLVGHGHAMLVLEEDLLQLKSYLGRDVQGILGYELFSRFIVDINYDRKIVTFHEPSIYTKKRKYTSIPITVEDTKPYITGVMNLGNGKELGVKLMVDTGASHSLLLDKNSNELITVPANHLDSNLGRGLAGDILGKIGRIDGLRIDKYVFPNVIATYPDSATYDLHGGRILRNGSIGGGILTRFRTVYDFANSMLYVKKSAAHKKPFEYNLSGLIVNAKGLNLRDFEIIVVRPNSAAEKAGLEVNDKIIEVNGTKANDLNLDQLVGLLNARNDKLVRVVVMRKGEKFYKKFRLERLI